MHRDCSGGSFFPSTDAVKQCAFKCSAVTMCGTVKVPEQHLKVNKMGGRRGREEREGGRVV